MKPQKEPKRNCKICDKLLPLVKGDYCDACRVVLENGGKPPLYICKECGEAYGEEKTQKGLPEGEATHWREAKCHCCKKKTQVTHYRKYGYLTKGHLAGKIDKENLHKELMPKDS